MPLYRMISQERYYWGARGHVSFLIAVLASASANAQESGADAVSCAGATGIAGAAGTTVIGLIAWVIKQYIKHKLEEARQEVARSYNRPVKLPPPAKRNSVIMIGLGGTGKTTLIRSLLHNPQGGGSGCSY